MGYHYRARYEMILFFEKGKRKLNNLSIPDIIQEPRVFKGYPTEKPVNVSKILIEQSSLEGEIVADPFCGSGSVDVATVNQGRIFWGNDVQEKAIALTENRLIDAHDNLDNIDTPELIEKKAPIKTVRQLVASFPEHK